MKKIIIEEMCDGFNITIVTPNEQDSYYHFSQEDSKCHLADLFKELGYEVEYEEVY